MDLIKKEDSMRVLVVGLGSMGKRRIRLIKQIDPGIQVIGVDSKPDRRP